MNIVKKLNTVMPGLRRCRMSLPIDELRPGWILESARWRDRLLARWLGCQQQRVPMMQALVRPTNQFGEFTFITAENLMSQNGIVKNYRP